MNIADIQAEAKKLVQEGVAEFHKLLNEIEGNSTVQEIQAKAQAEIATIQAEAQAKIDAVNAKVQAKIAEQVTAVKDQVAASVSTAVADSVKSAIEKA